MPPRRRPVPAFTYNPWRHGGWYVPQARYPSGAIGCVSRNYPDRKWRIVCDPRPFDTAPTYRSRDDAAGAEVTYAARLRALCEAGTCPRCPGGVRVPRPGDAAFGRMSFMLCHHDGTPLCALPGPRGPVPADHPDVVSQALPTTASPITPTATRSPR